VEVALGVDVGTGSTKAGLIDRAGRLVAVGRAAHVIDEPQPGWSESAPEQWLDAAAEAIARCLAEITARPEIMAIGFSGQMHGAVVCDAGVAPIRPAVLWSDRRAEPYLDQAGRLEGIANPIVAGMAGPTVAALRATEPAVMAGARWVLQPKDWVRHALTGQVATDASDASATLLWDDQGGAWSSEACEAFGVDPHCLAPVLDSDQPVGAVTEAGAARFGLPVGVPVAVGAADTAAALLGAGVGIGETQVSTGTGGQIARLIDRLQLDPHGRTHLYRAADVDGHRGWYAMAAIQNAGVAIDWALATLGTDLAGAAAAMAATKPGSNGVTFLPYLTGERTPHLDSTLTGGWIGLRPTTDRNDLIRSVFEGVAFALADGVNALVDAGHTVDRALLAGGGSTAHWWRQLLADGLNRELTPHDAADASVRGAGLLAWSTIGHRVDPAAGVNRLDPVTPAAGPDRQALAEAAARFRARFRAAARH
jgi:xylulokinase